MASVLPLVMMEGDVEKVKELGPAVGRVPFIEMSLPFAPSALELMSKLSSPRLLKSHLKYEFLQRHIESDKLKVILLLRNPKDAITSYYHFYKDMPFMGSFPGTFQDFFELVKAEHLLYGTRFHWYKNWWPHSHQNNVLVVRYEDMVRDCAGVVHRMAKFCDKEINPATAEEIVNICSMESLRKKAMTEHAAMHFFRKGVIGDWKNCFTEEESVMVDCWNPLAFLLNICDSVS